MRVELNVPESVNQRLDRGLPFPGTIRAAGARSCIRCLKIESASLRGPPNGLDRRRRATARGLFCWYLPGGCPS